MNIKHVRIYRGGFGFFISIIFIMITFLAALLFLGTVGLVILLPLGILGAIVRRLVRPAESISVESVRRQTLRERIVRPDAGEDIEITDYKRVE